ncbi:MAG: DUF624 domain-containing protein [Lachnospiraceae bacterium]|nr:DUF624 domain-containing protein [Lachnospiraceae bacterium]
MKSLFDPDGPFLTVLTAIANVAIVNILTLALCVPMVTAGAAFTAADYVLFHMVEQTDTYIVRSYFKSFKENFRQATVIWLLYLVVILLGAADVYIIRHSDAPSVGLIVVLVVIAAIFLSGMIYTFAYLSRYSDKTGVVLKNAWILDFANLPKSVLMVLVMGGAFYATYRFYMYAIPFFLIFGIAGPSIFNMSLMRSIFYKLEGRDPRHPYDEE